MRFRFLFYLLLCFQSLFAEEIRVYLSTTSLLQPLYLSKIQCSDESLSESYLAQLYSVLKFDLNYNGKTCVLATQPDREEVLRNHSFQQTLWKNWGVTYAICGQIHNQRLTLTCFSTHTGAVHHFPAAVLSGSLSKDRKILHRLSDAVFKTLFGIEGVASTQLLYSVKERKGDRFISEIWCCDWDGANPRRLTYENNYSITPVSIPPSDQYANDKFLYVSYKMGQSKIFISSMSQKQGKRLIDLKGNQLLPAISRKRDKIAFVCDISAERADLFVQQFHPQSGAIGKPIQLFSYPKSTQASPTFSPDGSKIAFVSDKDGSPRIYLIAVSHQEKKGSPLLITKKNGENSCPSWSPDGKKIAYSAKTKGIRQIWIYDFDTQEERQLTEGGGNKENPSWAPDSCHLVFNSTDGHTSELYLVNLSQPDVIKISSGPGVKHYPSWASSWEK